jgi:hypothetical protein
MELKEDGEAYAVMKIVRDTDLHEETVMRLFHDAGDARVFLNALFKCKVNQKKDHGKTELTDNEMLFTDGSFSCRIFMKKVILWKTL